MSPTDGTQQTTPATEHATRDPIVGIDLGTTNSVVAYCDAAGPRVLTAPTTALPNDNPLVPSVVRFNADATLVIGREALEHASDFPERTVASAKRLLGRSVHDAAPDLPFLGYRVIAGAHDTARIAIPREHADDLIVSPQEVSAHVLRALAERATAALGTPVRRAVVTVPAYFDDAQRQATRDAGRLAGLDVVRIVNEPTAAALAYGLGLEREQGRNRAPGVVAVFDLGGGTFDVSILRITPSEQHEAPGADAGNAEPAFYQVLATAGDTRLGGDDVDHLLVTMFAREIRAMLDRPDATTHESPGADAIDLDAFDAGTRRALVAFARSVKHRLSEAETATVRIVINSGTVYERTVTRHEFEALITPWADRTTEACTRALRDARRALDGDPIDAVVLVGGSTRMPLVRARCAQLFGIEPYTALDPDRVVALGAAVQASILSGHTTDQLLLDVIPLSLGVETVGGAVAKLIMRNSPVPARATERFSTSVDNQTAIQLNVLQGEREMAQDCRSLGTFELRGIPPMPAGIPQVEVAFAVDANGVLNVSAMEHRSGKRAGVQIVPNHGLDAAEVERIEAESFAHAREDMQRHRVVDLITNASLDVKWIGERFAKHADDLEPAYRAALRAQLDEVRAMIGRAKADWTSIDADAFAKGKAELDDLSVRLQEISIAASLRRDAGG